jgi:hypothetical protein
LAYTVITHLKTPRNRGVVQVPTAWDELNTVRHWPFHAEHSTRQKAVKIIAHSAMKIWLKNCSLVSRESNRRVRVDGVFRPPEQVVRTWCVRTLFGGIESLCRWFKVCGRFKVCMVTLVLVSAGVSFAWYDVKRLVATRSLNCERTWSQQLILHSQLVLSARVLE